MSPSLLATADRGLAVRIGTSLLVLATLTVAFVWVTLRLLEWTGSLVSADLTHVSRSPLVLGLVTVGLLAAGTVYGYHRTLERTGAEPTPRDDRPELYAIADRLAASAGVPTPTIAVIDSDVPNSLAVGRPSNATIVVSTALLEALSDDELEAVLAHEVAHVANRDALVMELAGALAGITETIVRVSNCLRDWAIDFSDGHWRKRPGEALWIAGISVVTFTVAAPFWIGARSVHRLLSQYRELAADRAGAVLAGSPGALASALVTLEEATPQDADLRARDGTQAMCILPQAFELEEDESEDEEFYLRDVDYQFSGSSGDESTDGEDESSEWFDDGPIDAGEYEFRSRSTLDRATEAVDASRSLRFPNTHPSIDERYDRLLELESS
ncbi:M48 family metalloprotease [Natronobacterium texcoconense]|uniref:M48 family metalloprotease n=1 Tax=Natronobacterium texcoconense TaxID=1095778 RepID=UPI00147D2AE9|nr:M48 family metalloprotease [Natronobacterium texcoconense]